MTVKYLKYDVADVEILNKDGSNIIFDATISVKIKDNKLIFTDVLTEENLKFLIKGHTYALKVTTPLVDRDTEATGLKELIMYYTNAHFDGIVEATFEAGNYDGFTYQFDVKYCDFEMDIVDVKK